MRGIFIFWATILISSGFAFAAEEAPQLPSPKEAMSLFNKADTELNEVWGELKKSLPEADFNNLKTDQREWVKQRDYLALSPGYSGAPSDDEAKARKSPEYLVAATELTQIRIAWLKAYGKPLKNNSLTGEWTDCNGGEMLILEEGGKLYFSISVVRGPTAHLGDISGLATWKTPKGFFTDKGTDPDRKDVTTLTFTLEGTQLKVVGENTSYYHGARAYFDGTYLCVRPLTADEQIELRGNLQPPADDNSKTEEKPASKTTNSLGL